MLRRTIFYLIFASVYVFLTDVYTVESTSSEFSLDDNTTDRCNDLLNEFASLSSKFGLCAVIHATPIKICQKCVDHYQDILHIYLTIQQSNNSKGQRCEEVLLNSDRLGILQQVYTNVQDLWTRGQCESCYTVNKTTGDYQLSNYSLKFNDLHAAAMACINSHTEEKGPQSGTVCQDCEKDYCALNDFYHELKDIYDDSVCMDIVDSMNKTRVLWSDELKCVRRTRTIDVPLLATTAVVSLLPLLFYLGAKLFSSQTRNQLQAQKRLAERITNEEEKTKPSTSNE